MAYRPTRRMVLSAAGSAGLLLATAGTASAGTTKRVQLRLPAPGGPWQVGTLSLRLIDRSRRDPWTDSPRELMISVWYPARTTCGHRRAPWMPSATTALYRQLTSRSLQTSLETVDFPLTHALLRAPVQPGRHPVVLYSPAFGAMRAFGTCLVEDLAGHGYVVVTIDHTHEAQIVEFPGGRLERGHIPDQPTDADLAVAMQARQGDVAFVLRRLAEGSHSLFRAFDLSRIGIFGHSLGGDTAAEAMAQDRRILAGADLDGSIIGAVVTTGLDRPFLLMSSADHGRHNDPSWEEFWSHLTGWRRQLRLLGSGHQTFTDLAPLVQQLRAALPIPEQVLAELDALLGTIDAGRAIRAQRAYLRAFFDLHLGHRDGGLLAAPSPRFPEIEFVP